MLKIRKGLYMVNKHMDLVYSPDDNGWYFAFVMGTRYTPSIVYSTKQDALHALDAGNIEWEGELPKGE